MNHGLPLPALFNGVKSPSPELNLPRDIRAYKQKPLPDIKTAADEMNKYKPRDSVLKDTRPKGILGLCRSPNNNIESASRLTSRRGARGSGEVLGSEKTGGYPSLSNRSSEAEVVINYEDFRTESRLEALVRSDINVFMDEVYGTSRTTSKSPSPAVAVAGEVLKPSQKLDMMLEVACMQGAVDSGYADTGRTTATANIKSRRRRRRSNHKMEGSRRNSGSIDGSISPSKTNKKL